MVVHRRRRVNDSQIRSGIQRSLYNQDHLRLAQLSVAPRTAQKRIFYFSRLEELLDVQGVSNITEETFLAFCVSVSRFYRAPTLESFRAALVWRQLEDMPICTVGLNLNCCTQSFRFRRRFKGACRLCLDPQPRGSITYEQLRELTRAYSNMGELFYAQGYAIAFYALLRHSQLHALRRDDVEIADEAIIRIRGGKARQRHEVDTVEAPEVKLLLRHLLQNNNSIYNVYCYSLIGTKLRQTN